MTTESVELNCCGRGMCSLIYQYNNLRVCHNIIKYVHDVAIDTDILFCVAIITALPGLLISLVIYYT